MREEPLLLRQFIHMNTSLFLTGRTIKGYKQGRLLGFPTANLDLISSPDLVEGVYLGYARVIPDLAMHPSLIFWGTPHFLPEAQTPRMEVHIIKQDIDLYDKLIEISLIDFIRENRKFLHQASLKEAIENDLQFALNYFKL